MHAIEHESTTDKFLKAVQCENALALYICTYVFACIPLRDKCALEQDKLLLCVHPLLALKKLTRYCITHGIFFTICLYFIIEGMDNITASSGYCV